ncbi:MAG TPA: hypothetical protein PKE20_10565, partial [Promineifilum sp.]|nr:hypothetical protein [Promineifilum sp.]
TVAETLKLYRELLDTRPDLQRRQEHGRWLRRTEKWGALLDQLAQLLRPSDGTAATAAPASRDGSAN